MSSKIISYKIRIVEKLENSQIDIIKECCSLYNERYGRSREFIFLKLTKDKIFIGQFSKCLNLKAFNRLLVILKSELNIEAGLEYEGYEKITDERLISLIKERKPQHIPDEWVDVIQKQSAEAFTTSDFSPDKRLKCDMLQNNVLNKKNSEATVFNKLDALIGIENVKQKIHEIVYFSSINKFRKNPDNISLHMAFTGNPGTGKTTVARIISEIFYEAGICKKKQLVEASRDDLVGQYIGSSESKTKSIIDSALGGILFIDEAYSLNVYGSKIDFGVQVINMLVKYMEDYRDKLIVIFAGYKETTEAMIRSNPGLKDRIGFNIHFEDYSKGELTQIFYKYATESGFEIDENCTQKVNDIMEKVIGQKDEAFSNARIVRKIFERTLIIQSKRLWMEKSENTQRNELISIKLRDLEKLEHESDLFAKQNKESIIGFRLD